MADTLRKVEWVTCNDCGEEYADAASFTHELTCKAKTGRAQASPPLEEYPVEAVEPGTGEEVSFNCFLCNASVTQDAAEDMTIDDRGNPVCSNTCRLASNRIESKGKVKPMRRPRKAKEPSPIDAAIAEYLKLEKEEAAMALKRCAAAARIIELQKSKAA